MTAVISLDEFNRSVAKLREWSQGVEQGTVETNPVHYRSGLRVRRRSLPLPLSLPPLPLPLRRLISYVSLRRSYGRRRPATDG